MAIHYREFAHWILNDLAIRKTENDRITFTGNHVCAQYLLPRRSKDDSDSQFAAKVREFRARLPRGSDFSERIAFATRALILDGEKAYIAADIIRQWLKQLPAEKKAEYDRAGIGHAFRPIDGPIGSTCRNRRTKEKKKQGVSTEESEAETIRTQASRFIRKHKNFEVRFQEALDSFRERFYRDEELYASVEASKIARVEAFETLSGPFDWFAAMPVAAAAQFYHEQGKFEQALFYYGKAIRAAGQAIMDEHFRGFVLHWLKVEVERCKRLEPMIPIPGYSGPRLPLSNVTELAPENRLGE
jgi:tetratricopeptide (TPR) repeat protein